MPGSRKGGLFRPQIRTMSYIGSYPLPEAWLSFFRASKISMDIILVIIFMCVLIVIKTYG